jgi:hypothetical protein
VRRSRETLVAYAHLDGEAVAEILDSVREDVPAKPCAAASIILDNAQGDDVMNLVVRKAFFLRDGEDDEPLAARV